MCNSPSWLPCCIRIYSLILFLAITLCILLECVCVCVCLFSLEFSYFWFKCFVATVAAVAKVLPQRLNPPLPHTPQPSPCAPSPSPLRPLCPLCCRFVIFIFPLNLFLCFINSVGFIFTNTQIENTKSSRERDREREREEEEERREGQSERLKKKETNHCYMFYSNLLAPHSLPPSALPLSAGTACPLSLSLFLCALLFYL